MDEQLIDNWNKKVSPNDTVIIIGDVFFCDAGRAVAILQSLNGRKELIYGNHDKQIKSNRHVQQEFAVIHPSLYERRIDDNHVVMCHYPMLSWNKSFHGSYMLHGHSHGSIPFDPTVRRVDVGVDVHNYAPISWAEIREIMEAVPLPSSGYDA